MTIANKMRIHRESLEDVTIVEKIMRSMLPKFTFVICCIEEFKDLDILSLDELQNSLMVYEQKIVQQDVEELALQITTISKDSGHRRSKCKGRNSEKTEEGNRKKNGQHDHDQRHSSNGKASNHLSGEKSAFSELDETFRTTVKFGDDSRIPLKGKGKVKLQTKSSSMQIIFDVFFAPDLKTNLISVGQLKENGYEVSIKHGICRMRDSNLGLIAKAKMTENKLFPLDMHDIGSTNFCFSTKLNSQAWLWHYRYGHLNFGGLKMLQQKKIVTGLPNFDMPVDICKDRVIGKQSRDSFPKVEA
ncbi:uncharacterized protein LOC125869931 [Solanum stenotomum]|uniref:uncharacterized protein LOC125869931 n=1 Tax=Solanum stenotomum TaxID=172797 RepID=UPI0020D0F7CD|nr:uncharacterized protein LOC125869931 [Solanum stenotomum]